jgi:nicotinate-nucleotide pyrophosphorylase (carboxylating)
VSGSFRLPDVDGIVAAALAEDLGVSPAALLTATPGLLDADVTGSLLPEGARFKGVVRMRSAGVVCGLPVAQRVWKMLAASAGAEAPECFPLVAEGAAVERGRAVLEVSGDARVVLAGERSALDFLMVLSGIATRSAQWQAAAGPSLVVVDTRKTVPGLRTLSKYAVAVGGASNHRMGLFDMVLIKDNHIAAWGGVAPAIGRARELHPSLAVEVEAEDVEQAAQAASCGADMVLLDNMDDAMLADAVAAVREATPAGRVCLIEASGGITLGRLASLAAMGVDRASASALTLAPPLDVGLDEGRDG